MQKSVVTYVNYDPSQSFFVRQHMSVMDVGAVAIVLCAVCLLTSARSSFVPRRSFRSVCLGLMQVIPPDSLKGAKATQILLLCSGSA